MNSPQTRTAIGTRIAQTSVIHPNVIIEEGVRIDDFCVIGCPLESGPCDEPLHLGAGSHIRSHSVLYQGSDFSGGIETGHHVLIREFTRAGRNLRVGSFSDIEGRCSFGDYVRCHSYAHIGQGSRVGNFVWIYSLVTLTNDPLPFSSLQRPVTLEDGVVVCGGATVLPGTIMRTGAMASAGSRVTGEIPAGAIVDNDGSTRGHVSNLIDFETGTRHPWMRHAADRYPAQAQLALAELLRTINASHRHGTNQHP